MDSNCQISSIFSKLAALLGLGPKYLQAGKKYFTQTGQRLEEAFGQVALLELFKITDVKAFQYASHKFKEGLEQRRSPTELLDMVVHAKKVRG